MSCVTDHTKGIYESFKERSTCKTIEILKEHESFDIVFKINIAYVVLVVFINGKKL